LIYIYTQEAVAYTWTSDCRLEITSEPSNCCTFFRHGKICKREQNIGIHTIIYSR